MDELEYRTILSQVLSAHLEPAVRQLTGVLRNLPAKTRGIDIEVFPDQDGEGTFSVRVGLDGPDLYVLNKAIDEWADLFCVRHTEKGLEPPVPLMEPGAESFEVNDIVVDCAAEWVQAVWQALGDPQPTVPVTVVGHDDYGTVTPLILKL
ncbi:MAG: hypothetical protein IID44_18340 [Planctomycetes bacterium]|nr:hypothetical protein [Planctomycetota bacterium]